MIIPDEVLQKFQALLQRDYPDREFPLDEVRDIFSRLIRLVKLVYRPIPKDRIEDFKRINGLPPYDILTDQQ